MFDEILKGEDVSGSIRLHNGAYVTKKNILGLETRKIWYPFQ